ncbi:hypothetical protein SDC9_144232 [bioreactor metagenome]|uniref:Uncharacterized protein n=1 Tax=bioreactor metagenome TaxID=1076179 RepID=A0A645E697_9ZZZZ
MLARKPRQLLHAVQILERVAKGLTALRVQHLLHRDLLPRLVAHGGQIVRRKVVFLPVFGHQGVDLPLGYGVHLLHQRAHRPGVYLPAKLRLRCHLVPLGNRHLAHVVAKTHHLEPPGERRARCRSHPVAQPEEHLLILPVARNHLARHAHPRRDIAVLPIPMRRLVQVHKVHVDLRVRYLAVVLRRNVAVRLLQIRKSVDPHLRRAERMAPRNHARAGCAVVRLADHVRDFLIRLHGRLVHQLVRQLAGGVHLPRHLLRARGDGLQHLRPIEKLTAD